MSPSTLPRRVFFCSGPPKSGTTYLQRLLDSHPEVACAPEQAFAHLAQFLVEATQKYNLYAAQLDRRTGGTGRQAFTPSQGRALQRRAILLLMQGRAGDKPLIGAKDNDILQRPNFFRALFPGARFLCILRNPLDRAVSGWHHNRRRAELEKNPQHLQLMARHEGLDGWAGHICRLMESELAVIRDAKLPSERRLLLRYEDLILRPLPELERILAFLGVDRSEETRAEMLRQSSLEALRKTAGDPAFFRSATVDGGMGELSSAVRQDLAQQHSALFAALGYRVTATGLELLPLDLD